VSGSLRLLNRDADSAKESIIAAAHHRASQPCQQRKKTSRRGDGDDAFYPAAAQRGEKIGDEVVDHRKMKPRNDGKVGHTAFLKGGGELLGHSGTVPGEKRPQKPRPRPCH
jgi:hypothetical protein